MPSTNVADLLAKLVRQMHTLQARNLEHLGLGMGNALILREIYSHYGITHGELCTLLKLDKSTVTQAIRKLVAAGYVEKKCVPDDRRSHHLLTTRMAKVLAPLFDLADQSLLQALLHGFRETDIEEFGKYLRRASANVDHVLNSPPETRFKQLNSGPHI